MPQRIWLLPEDARRSERKNGPLSMMVATCTHGGRLSFARGAFKVLARIARDEPIFDWQTALVAERSSLPLATPKRDSGELGVWQGEHRHRDRDAMLDTREPGGKKLASRADR